MRSQALTPTALARWADARLAAASAWRAPRRATRFFKPGERVYTWGLSTPRWRAAERSAFALVRGRWRYPDALALAERLSRRRALESRMLGFELLGRFRDEFPRSLLRRVHGWLAQGRCDNWALTDGLCATVLSPLLHRFPALIERLVPWTRSRSVWVRRAAAVALVPSARRGERLEAAYASATALRHDRNDLVHKAVGWLLREAGKTDMRRLDAYLRRNGPSLARTTLRDAIERFPPAQRREILLRTRSRPYPSPTWA
jgi:hypothetical protein